MKKSALMATLLVLISVASSSPLTRICETIKSSIVMIESPEEEEFLIRLARYHGTDVWIGLSDLVQEGHFVWVDMKQKLTYTHWFPGQPNGGNAEDCVLLYGGLWHDYPCNETHAAICEKHSSVWIDK